MKMKEKPSSITSLEFSDTNLSSMNALRTNRYLLNIPKAVRGNRK